MTIQQNKFFKNEVQLVRFDGHSANGFTPIGTHVYLDFVTAGVQTATPPEGAVGFQTSISGAVRFVLDEGTTPTASVGFAAVAGGAVVNIVPGRTLRVFGAAGAGMNIQWVGTV